MKKNNRKGRYGAYVGLDPDFKPPVISKERIDAAIDVAQATPNFTDLSWLKGQHMSKPHILDLADIINEFMNANRRAVMNSANLGEAARKMEENKAQLKEKLDKLGIELDYSER